MSNAIFIPEGGLIQSAIWADFLRAKGVNVIAIHTDNRTLYGSVQRLPFVGNYLYVPRFPCDVSVDSCEAIVQAARSHNCFWIRTDLVSDEQVDMFQGPGYRSFSAPHDMQTRENFIVDLSISADDLLAGMKSKTRYNIRLAEKKEVGVRVVHFSDDYFDEAFQAFFTMVSATAVRKGVRFHGEEHYLQMFATLPHDAIALYVAMYDGEVVAANIMTFYGGVATYLHGATSDRYRTVMAPFLLQWQALMDTYSRGMDAYDFGGYYTQTDDPGKKGISRFKKGFAPHTVPTPSGGSWDVVLVAWRYRLYLCLQRIKNILT